jgi:hypothetical protein
MFTSAGWLYTIALHFKGIKNMKESTCQVLREIVKTATAQHIVYAEQLQTELAAEKDGHPTPPHAKRGRSTLRLIVDKKKNEALRVVFAIVALEGREATFGKLTLKDCFADHSQAVRSAHRLRLADIYPELPASEGCDMESDLEQKGIHFSSRRVASLVPPKS